MELARCLAGEAVVPTDGPDATGYLRDLLEGEGVTPQIVGGRVIAAIPAGRDPIRPILAGLLGAPPRRVRWGIGMAAGEAEAAVLAHAALDLGGRRLITVRGAPGAGAVDLEDRVAVLLALLAGTTARQGEIARRILVDGRRQAEVAAEFGVTRATVSVAVARGHVAAVAAAGRILAAGLAACPGEPAAVSAEVGG
jgi:hypothetical protein